jgi:protein-disulfide isomerase
MTRRTRRERRLVELEERRAERRDRRPQGQRSWLLPASLGALALGLVAVVAFAVLSTPPAVVELEEPLPPSPYHLADGRALGLTGAPVTLEIWSDFQCPACKQLVDTIEPRLVDDYVADGRLRVTYRDFAFLGQESTDAAVAARCADREGRFWPFHDYLFANQSGENRGAFSRDRLASIAERVGLEMAGYRACLDDGAIRQAVADELDEGRALGVNSTPSLLVGGRLFAGVPDYGQLSAAIDAALAEAAMSR